MNFNEGEVVGPSKHIFSHQHHISYIQSFELKSITESIEAMKELPIKIMLDSKFEDAEEDSESDDEPAEKKRKLKINTTNSSSYDTLARWVPISNLSKVVSTTNAQKLISLFQVKK